MLQQCIVQILAYILQGHTGSVNEIAIPESMGNRILSCGDDGNICVWEVKRKKKGLIRMLRGNKIELFAIIVVF